MNACTGHITLSLPNHLPSYCEPTLLHQPPAKCSHSLTFNHWKCFLSTHCLELESNTSTKSASSYQPATEKHKLTLGQCRNPFKLSTTEAFSDEGKLKGVQELKQCHLHTAV